MFRISKGFSLELYENSAGRGHLAKLHVSDPAHKKVLIVAFVNSKEEQP